MSEGNPNSAQKEKDVFALAIADGKNIDSEKGTTIKQEGDYKIQPGKKICVKVYFNPKSFQAVANDAEKSGKRARGLQLFTQKPHGFAHELVSNTDGIGRFLKHAWLYWQEHEKERLEQAVALAQEERELAERKKKLGMV